MGPVGLPSHDTRTLAGLAVGLSGVESSSLPRDGASLAAAADEKPIVYRLVCLLHTRQRSEQCRFRARRRTRA